MKSKKKGLRLNYLLVGVLAITLSAKFIVVLTASRFHSIRFYFGIGACKSHSQSLSLHPRLRTTSLTFSLFWSFFELFWFQDLFITWLPLFSLFRAEMKMELVPDNSFFCKNRIEFRVQFCVKFRSRIRLDYKKQLFSLLTIFNVIKALIACHWYVMQQE